MTWLDNFCVSTLSANHPAHESRSIRVNRRSPGAIAHGVVSVNVRKNLHLADGEYERASTQLLKALRTGSLDRTQRLRFDRVLSGMRRWERHLIYRAWGLSIFDLARVVAQSYGGRHSRLRGVALP